ncbi:hypothetical protein JCM19232_3343 [Vibrio ishigakensis]|uniref:Uncharacterized protein n=1 Tax=Vibrio ishigakensis TaxID=1481914 RepID=A0A0B8PHF4_9VIBR|nr:hypothetical protein JCM19232_3343 [Vibrio ishigakensis]
MQISKIAMTAGMLAASASAVAADKPNILAILVMTSASGTLVLTTKA